MQNSKLNSLFIQTVISAIPRSFLTTKISQQIINKKAFLDRRREKLSRIQFHCISLNHTRSAQNIMRLKKYVGNALQILKKYSRDDAIRILDFYIGYVQLNRSTIPKIKESIKRLNKVTTFKMHINSAYQLNGKQFLALMKGFLRDRKQISNLELGFSHCNLKTDDFQRLKDIRFLRKIQNLTLDLSKNNDITDLALMYIGKTLKRLIKLQKLDINFAPPEEYNPFRDPPRLTDKGIAGLVQFWDKLSIRELKLNFLNNLNVGEDRLIHLGEGIKRLKNLQLIDLDLSHNNVRDNDINILKNAFLTHKSIHSLTLNLDYCYITDQSLIYVAESIEEKSELRNLSISVKNNNLIKAYIITNIGVVSLVESLTKLTQLKHLYLDVSVPLEGDKSIFALENSLNRLTQLKSLTIIMDKNKNVSEAAFIRMISSLKNLIHLEKLELHFCSSERLTDDTIHHLVEIIKELKSLKTIELGMNHCNKMTDAAITALKQHAVAALHSLKILRNGKYES